MLSFSSCTCIYFNTFHNIRKNFNTAQKSRDKDGRDKARGGEIKKYSDAIAKASRILERHPTSSWVDDALYIIGASYYYLGDFDKSARKFKELFANYPESEYLDRSRILLAKAKLQLKEETESIVLFEEIFASGKNREMKAEAARSLGYYYFENKEFDKADGYFQSLIDSLGDSDDRLRAYIFMADGNFDRFMFRPAFENYDEALDEDPDTLQYYHLQYRMAECEYFLGQLGSGLDRIQKLADNELYYDSLAALHLKIAEGYEWDGDMEAAIDIYDKITIEAEGKNEAAIAFYELGLIHQYDLEDYSKAQDYYAKARGAKRRSSIYEDATKRASKLALLEQYNRSALTSDTEDSSATLTSAEIDQMGENQFLLGELFYFDLEKPDSAAHAYQLLIEKYPTSRFAPRALLSLSYIQRRDFYDTVSSDSLLRLVLTDYAHYDEAENVINLLGLAGTVADSGYAALPFEKGENFLGQILDLEESWHYASPLDQIIEDSLARLKEALDSLGGSEGSGSVFQAIDSLVSDSLVSDSLQVNPDTLMQIRDTLNRTYVPTSTETDSTDSITWAFADTTAGETPPAPPRRLSDLMSELRENESEKEEQKEKAAEELENQIKADTTKDIGAGIIDSIMKLQAAGDTTLTAPASIDDLTIIDSTTEKGLIETEPKISSPDSGMVIDTSMTGPIPDSLLVEDRASASGTDSLTATTDTTLVTDSLGISDSTAVVIEEPKRPTMEILDSIWNNVVELSRGEGHEEILNLLDSTKHYLRYVIDSFPHSRYNSQAQYVLLWTYDNYLATGDSVLSDLYADYVDSFPQTEYADLIATKYKITPRRVFAKTQKQVDLEEEDQFQDAEDDTTLVADQPIDTTSSETSAISAFITDGDGNQLPPAEEYFLLYERKFEYPIEALPYGIEGVFYFHVRINFDGQVEEFRMINPSPSDELNEVLEKVILQTRFDNGKMPPELYDHWFYFPFEVRIPQSMRQ